jgi:hypothetical protein
MLIGLLICPFGYSHGVFLLARGAIQQVYALICGNIQISIGHLDIVDFAIRTIIQEIGFIPAVILHDVSALGTYSCDVGQPITGRAKMSHFIPP